MENFSSLFMRLKEERGVSNKPLASFTGAKLKEVKKWDAGTSFPTDKKVIVALEGLLGKEVMDTLEDLSSYDQVTTNSTNVEDSLFNIDRDKKVELKSGIFNRFKSEKQETKDIPQPELFTYENIQDTEDISDFEADAQKETFETALDEKPYIEYSKQFSFYLTRNMKTFFTLLAISVLIVRGFRLFLDSMKIIIDNLL